MRPAAAVARGRAGRGRGQAGTNGHVGPWPPHSTKQYARERLAAQHFRWFRETPTVASGGTVNTPPREAATLTQAIPSRRVPGPGLFVCRGGAVDEVAVCPKPARMPRSGKARREAHPKKQGKETGPKNRRETRPKYWQGPMSVCEG